MHLEYTPEQQRLRTELRTYFAALVPDNAYARYAEPAAQKRFYRDTVRRLGADGWLGVGWPKEYGGRGLSPMEQFIFFDEAAQAGVPLPLMALNTVGPTIMQYGTDEQKAHFLPGILAGRSTSRSATANRTRAPTSLPSKPGRSARATPTSSTARRSGPPTATPPTGSGSRCAPTPTPRRTRASPCSSSPRATRLLLHLINTLASHDTTASYYEDIRVPVSRRVGEENKGWRLIATSSTTNASPSPPTRTMAVRALHNVQRWAADTKLADGRRVIDLGWVRALLARTHTRLDAMKLLNWQMVAALRTAPSPRRTPRRSRSTAPRPAGDAYAWLMEIVGSAGALKEGSAGAVLHGELERGYRSAVIFTFGGGNSEIQREIISWIGLGMPRVRR